MTVLQPHNAFHSCSGLCLRVHWDGGRAGSGSKRRRAANDIPIPICCICTFITTAIILVCIGSMDKWIRQDHVWEYRSGNMVQALNLLMRETFCWRQGSVNGVWTWLCASRRALSRVLVLWIPFAVFIIKSLAAERIKLGLHYLLYLMILIPSPIQCYSQLDGRICTTGMSQIEFFAFLLYAQFRAIFQQALESWKPRKWDKVHTGN